ncbi:baculoviral IAP repeat-containing protein 7-like [Mercenaria mercenaria]|uniref:baculoviral IAP repeat-containing protein 7-like n=1 Tax=Mercenaria mercenaria TaxID=6596 RepID=UPI00234F76F5|nr:baculoviral IAP repeat-containing protein 7-like [Mercenaria mercenaria]
MAALTKQESENECSQKNVDPERRSVSVWKGEADVCSGCILKNGRRTNNEIDIGLHERLSPKNGERTEYRPTEEIQYFPGITNEKPKHPDFAIRRARLSSFSQWTKGHVMKPEDLAEAGFYFSGVRDFVRCFFCGGGLKNWEYGDSPWIEHARRFSTCAYIKQCKGEHFITLCQISNMTFPTQINVQLRDLDSGQTNIVEDQCITDLNSIAAKRVLDMGYMQTQTTVIQANASATTTTPGQHSNTTRNRSQSSSPNSRQSDQSNVAIDERKSLNEENRQELKEQIMCKICFDKDANIVLLPCGHLASCVECAHALRKCAICRTVIQGTVRIYQA